MRFQNLRQLLSVMLDTFRFLPSHISMALDGPLRSLVYCETCPPDRSGSSVCALRYRSSRPERADAFSSPSLPAKKPACAREGSLFPSCLPFLSTVIV